MIGNAKKSIITLYGSVSDIHSHRVRIALAEKGIAVEIIEDASQEDIADLSPYGSLPILIDRDLVLYESRIIMEYLDERFPHPPLLPVYPVRRAEYRLIMFRIENEWYKLANKIQSATDSEEKNESCKLLLENLCELTHVLQEMPYFCSEEFTLIDCCMAPLLWRLPALNIKLPKSAKVVSDYAERLFKRPSFEESLTETEREIRFPLAIAS